jgi:hypothetical protein
MSQAPNSAPDLTAGSDIAANGRLFASLRAMLQTLPPTIAPGKVCRTTKTG